MSDKERAAFEAWATAQRFINVPFGGTGVLPTVAAIEMAWQASADRSAARIAELEAEVGRLNADKGRIDWLADPSNHIGNVSLPVAIVERNLQSLRDAIDEAMKGDK